MARPTGLYLPTRAEMIPVEQTGTSQVAAGTVQWDVPRSVAGHHYDSPACGQAGNVIVNGHSIWYGETGAFAPLLSVEVGDMIGCVNDDGEVFSYRITRKWSSAYEDGSWLTQPGDGVRQITLYTCNLDLTALVVVQGEF